MKKTHFILAAFCLLGSLGLKAQTMMKIHKKGGVVLQIPVSNIDSVTHTINDIGQLPTVKTLPIIHKGSFFAACGGQVTNSGSSNVWSRGAVWSTSPNLVGETQNFRIGGDTGFFRCNLSSLKANTTYYVRAFATNKTGTAFGEELIFTTYDSAIVSNTGSGVTFDGYNYKTIVLGNGQEWMAENLRTTIYANGDKIENVTAESNWSNLTTGAWAYYNNDSKYENPYGKLYNAYAAVDPRNVCPAGWHVPIKYDWDKLLIYLDKNDLFFYGNKLKNAGTQYWSSPNQGATNETGFNGLPGGARSNTGVFSGIGNTVDFWWGEKLRNGQKYADIYSLNHNKTDFYHSASELKKGHSVRCVKD
jgi:uncharacterized protein (TIGR02145 family)